MQHDGQCRLRPVGECFNSEGRCFCTNACLYAGKPLRPPAAAPVAGMSREQRLETALRRIGRVDNDTGAVADDVCAECDGWAARPHGPSPTDGRLTCGTDCPGRIARAALADPGMTTKETAMSDRTRDQTPLCSRCHCGLSACHPGPPEELFALFRGQGWDGWAKTAEAITRGWWNRVAGSAAVAGMTAPEPPYVMPLCTYCGAAAGEPCAHGRGSFLPPAPAAPAEPRGEAARELCRGCGHPLNDPGALFCSVACRTEVMDASASPSPVGEPDADMTLDQACDADEAGEDIEWRPRDYTDWGVFNGWDHSLTPGRLRGARFRRRPQHQPAPQRSPRVDRCVGEAFGEEPSINSIDAMKLCKRVLWEFVKDAGDNLDYGLSFVDNLAAAARRWLGDAPVGGRK